MTVFLFVLGGMTAMTAAVNFYRSGILNAFAVHTVVKHCDGAVFCEFRIVLMGNEIIGKTPFDLA